MRPILVLGISALLFAAAWLVQACSDLGSAPAYSAISVEESPRIPLGAQYALGTELHEQEVMRSVYCAGCHPADYAEHEQNTHGRAFTDEEVRLGTGRFSQSDCIVCHTPRPIFETGIGQNPKRRMYDLAEGNTCMTCHWQKGFDYARFEGGAQCAEAFDPRVGEVEACASCHRNHGTPYQWEIAQNGKAKGRVCIDCHMPLVEREVAVGGPVREVRTHAFVASRSESQLRSAYTYAVRLEGNEAVVAITNSGAGHNFPTELKQRSVESLVVVRNGDGQEIARSRMLFRDPYKRPYGLALPVNTQIPSGETREHRVPIGAASGTVTTELHYKLYFPIEDNHPELARQLESRTLAFQDLTPSTKPVEGEPEVKIVTPEGISAESASPADLVDYARPKIAKVEVDIPQGARLEDVPKLIELFQFPVPQANAEARAKLIQIGMPAVPALVTALGSWDNKTYNQSMAVLEKIGAPAAPALLAALRSDRLYVRLHASELLARIGIDSPEALAALREQIQRPEALDRAQAATSIGELKLVAAQPDLMALLADRDPDVVRAAARALARLGAKEAVPLMRAALDRFVWDETRRDLAEALAKLGDPSGIALLIRGLEHSDDLVRESMFETLFAVTGLHAGYEPLAPRDQRLPAIAAIASEWAEAGANAAARLRHPPALDSKTRAELRKAVEAFGGGDGLTPAGDDEKLKARFLELGEKAVGTICYVGLKYPAGFADKRAKLCQVLGEIGSTDAVPTLISTLRDPVVSVAAWAADALAKIGDPSAAAALERYQRRLLSLAAAGRIPVEAGTPDGLLAQAASARFRIGDGRMREDLVGYLLSEDVAARRTAWAALQRSLRGEIEYDPEASRAERLAVIASWKRRR